MLVNNYRSHASILRLPSELFYFGALRECASHDLTHTFVNWHMLPKPGVPLVFHGVRVSLRLLPISLLHLAAILWNSSARPTVAVKCPTFLN